MKVRVIGALIVEDEEGEDPKVLSTLMNDARFDVYRNIADVHTINSGKFKNSSKPTRG